MRNFGDVGELFSFSNIQSAGLAMEARSYQ